MNQRQNNKLNMYTNVSGVLNENKQVYESYAPVVETSTLFLGMVSEIRTHVGEQTVDYTGVTDEKTLVKEEMAQEAADLAKAGLAYAQDTGNVLLAAHFDYSYSDIRYSTNNKAAEIAQVILDDVISNIDNLGNYLVYQEDADNLQALITKFNNLGETRSDAHSMGVATTRKIGELFKQTDNLLEYKLDALVTRLRKKEPMFFAAYMNARQIIDLGGKQAQGNSQV